MASINVLARSSEGTDFTADALPKIFSYSLTQVTFCAMSEMVFFTINFGEILPNIPDMIA
jgi:hypothetical protein